MITVIGIISGMVLVSVWMILVRVIVPEGYAGLLYRNGRIVRRLQPGLYYLPRVGTRWSLIDMRLRIMTITGQEVISQDNLALKLSIAVVWRVVDPERSAHVVQDVETSLRTAVQLCIRTALSERKLEQAVESRSTIGGQVLPRVVDEAVSFGVEVKSVEVKDVTLPGELKKIFNEVVKAQQQGRAALERARGESAALRNLANAARMLEETPALMDLRLLQTVGAEGGNTLFLGWQGSVMPPKNKATRGQGESGKSNSPGGDT